MIVAFPPIIPYTDIIRWLVELVDPNTQMFRDASKSLMVSFKPKFIAGMYSLGTPQQLLIEEFLKKLIPKFNLDELIKSWMDAPTLYACIPDRKYPIFLFKEPYSLLAAMFFRLYGLPNFSHLMDEWDPIAYHIISTSESFSWAQILSMVLMDFISQEEKTKSSKKPKFYLFAYVIDIIFSSFSFATMNWNWTRETPPIQINVCFYGKTIANCISMRSMTVLLEQPISLF